VPCDNAGFPGLRRRVSRQKRRQNDPECYAAGCHDLGTIKNVIRPTVFVDSGGADRSKCHKTQGNQAGTSLAQLVGAGGLNIYGREP
jgi:hypothetical protein